MVSYKNMRAFVEVAQAATFADAAKRLFLSQPALSASIKNMEIQLGGKLFIRTTRRIELTPEGRAFLPQAKRVLADYDASLEDVKALFKAQQGNLVVSSMPSFAEGQLADILEGFTVEHANINIRILDVVMEQVIENVLAQRAEVGFVFKPHSLQGLQFIPLFTDEFCAVMPKSHPLSSQARCSLRDLLAFEMVAMNRGSTIRRWLDDKFEQHLKQFGEKANIVAEASQLGTIGQLVAHNAGVAIVPALCKNQMLGKGLMVKPLSNLNMPREVGAIILNPPNLSSAGKRLIDYITPTFT
jgi:LysR family carnitine catabolism transcriptional activator